MKLRTVTTALIAASGFCIVVFLALVVISGTVWYNKMTAGRSQWAAPLLQETRLRGVAVIEALNRYRQDHGAYPTTLEALRPQYLESIPQPTAGEGRWRYDRMAADEYRLACWMNTTAYPRIWYTSRSSTWEVDN